MSRLSFAAMAAIIIVSFLLSLAATVHIHDKGIHLTKENQDLRNSRLVAGDIVKQDSNSKGNKKSEVTLEWLKKDRH